MAIGDLVEWEGYLGMIASYDEYDDPFVYLFEKKYTILVYKGECKTSLFNALNRFNDSVNK